jgi:hypothetical protein
MREVNREGISGDKPRIITTHDVDGINEQKQKKTKKRNQSEKIRANGEI